MISDGNNDLCLCLDESSDDEEPLQFQPAIDLARFKQFIESEQQAVSREQQHSSALTQSQAERKLQEMLNIKPGIYDKRAGIIFFDLITLTFDL